MPIPSGVITPNQLIITYADAQAVATAMGATVTEPNVVMAEYVVSSRAGVTLDPDFDASALDTKDLYWLQRAVVSQAIWLNGQPDLMSRLDAVQISTDGDSMNLNHDGMLLAPLAKWALIKTSFLQSGYTDVAPVGMVIDVGRVQDRSYYPWGG